MLIVYSKDTTSFHNNGLGVLREFVNTPIITEVLNAEYNLEFEYLVDGWLSEHLIEENIIKANGQPFRIVDIEKNLKRIKVLAKHIAFDLNDNFLENVAPTDLDGTSALNWILDRTQYPHNFTAWSDVETIASARYVRKNIFEAFISASNSVVNRWGGEFEYDNFLIKLHQRRGENRGLQIRHRKNLTGFDLKTDFTTVATRIMPQGNDELLLPELYIDSPRIENYRSPIVRRINFDVSVDDDTTEEEALNQLRFLTSQLYEKGIDLPTVSIKVDFIELSKVEEYKHYSNLESVFLGDTVQVYIDKLGLELETRVVKTVYDCLKGRYIQLELGTVTPNFVNQQINQIEEINQSIERINPVGILEKAKQEATEMLKHPFDGYIYIDDNSGEMYLMDTTDINTATNIWKFGLGGIGFSSTGINGEYETAWTQDGKIVADFIATGTLDGSLIRAGSIQASQISTEALTSGGNNIIYDSVGSYGTDWDGIVKSHESTELKNNTISGRALFLQNDTITQIIQVPNDKYTISFKYRKLIQLANCSIEINGHVIELDSSDWNRESYTFEVLSNQIEIKIISDTNDACYLSDLMGNIGIIPQSWTPANGESENGGVRIGKSIEITSSGSNIKQVIDNDGNRIININTDEVVAEFTDKGVDTEELQAKKAEVSKVLIVDMGNQTWFSRM